MEGDKQAQPEQQAEDNDTRVQLNDKNPRTLSHRLTTVVAEGTGIQAKTGLESIEWVEKERFLGKVFTLLCEDVWTAAEGAKKHADEPRVVSVWMERLPVDSGWVGTVVA